jgi:hypothetical protein
VFDGVKMTAHLGVKAQDPFVQVEHPSEPRFDRQQGQLVKHALHVVRQSGQLEHDREARVLRGRDVAG